MTLTLEKIIGHRGAAAYAPENTLASFDKALHIGCHFIEFDVMLSADGEPFVFHDYTLRRTTNGRGETGKVDAAYLNTLDAGGWFSRKFKGEKIPHFKDILNWLTFCEVQANIEIKPFPQMGEQTAVTVLTYLNRYWPHHKPLPLVSSFDRNALHICHSLSPELPLGLLLDKWDPQWEQLAKELNCFSIHYCWKQLTQERITQIKTQGYRLLAYTVNKRRLAEKLFSWGVDAIFSDYPDLLQ